MKNTIAILILTFVLLVFLSMSFILFVPYGAGFEREIIIEPGASINSIISGLKSKELIRSRLALKLLLRATGNSGNIKAGTYLFPRRISLYDLVVYLVEGKFESEDIRVTIPEGSTVIDIEQILIDEGVYRKKGFAENALMKDDFRDLWVLNNLKSGDYMEGYLFPDTYNFLAETEFDDVLRTMVENLQDQIARYSESEIPDRFSSFNEWLTLASIVQKESPADDMDAIAGVFANRIKIGKRLESDATVNYFLGTSKLIPTFGDITVRNDYNTYLIPGLPPTPISNPGISALAATAEPEEHNYFFFLHTPDEVTILSRTFEEHLTARSRYWE